MPLRRGMLLCLVACLGWTAPAAAQLGELQLGGLVSYGAPRSFRQGFGAVAGIGLARLVYAGARWTYQTGGRERPRGTQGEIATRTQLLTADLGAMLPVAGVEIVPGVGVGSLRFTQTGANPATSWKLAVVPGVAMHVHVAGTVAIPELNYVWSATPHLPLTVPHRGPVAALRLVIPIELRRIRY